MRSPRTGVTDRCELPCGCSHLNPGSLEKQPVPLTAEHFSPLKDFSLMTLFCFFWKRAKKDFDKVMIKKVLLDIILDT